MLFLLHLSAPAFLNRLSFSKYLGIRPVGAVVDDGGKESLEESPQQLWGRIRKEGRKEGRRPVFLFSRRVGEGRKKRGSFPTYPSLPLPAKIAARGPNIWLFQ